MMTQIFELEKQRDSQSPPLPSVNKPEEIQELLWEKCDLYLQTYLQDWDTQGTSNPIEVQHVLDTLMKVMEGLNIDEPDDESIRSVSDNASSRSLTVSSSVRSMSSEQSSSPSVIERVDDLSRSRKCVNKMLSSLDDLVKLLAEKPQELAKVRVESLRQSFTDTTEI